MIARLALPLAAAAFTLCACTAPAASATLAPAVGESATVTRVVDGDTVHVRTSSGQNLDVRVIGEDSPEVVKPRTPVQCWGPQASAEAHRVLDGQSVTLRPDPTQARVDRYKRNLFYVTLPSGEDLSLHMVAGGFSRAYKVSGPVPQEWPQLVAAQGQAQAAKRGLWGLPCDGGR